MNHNIKKKLRKRNWVYRKAKKTDCPSLRTKYKSLRNELVHLIRKAKKDHLKKMSKLGKKQFWRTVKFLKKTLILLPSSTSRPGFKITSTCFQFLQRTGFFRPQHGLATISLRLLRLSFKTATHSLGDCNCLI